MALAVIGLSPKPHVQANNYDVVIEATIGQEDYKVIEINNATGDVNFYEFTVDGNPVLDGNNEQTTFVPGDNDFEDRLSYLNDVIISTSLTIASSTEFALPIFVGDGYYGDTITQVCYDGDSSTDYRVVQHNEMDDPFVPASLIGTFAYMEVGETTYAGFRYTPNAPLGQWDQAAISGNNSGSTSAEEKNDPISRPAKFTIIGTTSSGKVVKIEDKGNGSGPKVFKWNDKDGDGEIDQEWDDKDEDGEIDEGEWNDEDGDGEVDNEWEEVEDDEEIEEIVDEVCDDIENGLGSYEVSAFDQDGNPIDAIIWFRKSDGTYCAFRITYTGDGTNHSWTKEAKNDVSSDCMHYLGYIPSSGDYNPTGAWSIGSKNPGATRYGWQNYWNNSQYWFNGGTTPEFWPISVSGYLVIFKNDTNGSWPTEPCPPF
jgi:hypothetical protein